MNEKKFDGMGKIYSAFRPNYPQSFIDYLISEVGIGKSSVIADVGSGTGILTKQLLECGNNVYGVEPNADMSEIAKKHLCEYKNFISVNGTAEHTTLLEKSVDFITVAQAFHWFDRTAFKIECQRILRSHGKVILVWNSRDCKSELIVKNDEINRKYCPNFKGFSGGMKGAVDEGDFSDFFTDDYERKVFQNPLLFDENGFIGRNLSSSYALKEDDENFSSYVRELKMLFNKHSKNQKLIMPNFTVCYVGKI